MKVKLCLAAIIFVFSSASCSLFTKTKASPTEELYINDGYRKSSTGEILFDDKTSKGISEAIHTSTESSQTGSVVARDSSQISVMTDGFGNTSESRCFNGHPRLKCVLLRTAADGERKVFVYGQNGEVKSLPENMFDKISTASADELANAAGIFETKKQRNLPMTAQEKPQKLQPMPSYKFPIQRPIPEEYETAQENAANDSDEENPDNQSEERRETITKNRDPEENQEN